jgi:hypothetical protein
VKFCFQNLIWKRFIFLSADHSESAVVLYRVPLFSLASVSPKIYYTPVYDMISISLR